MGTHPVKGYIPTNLEHNFYPVAGLVMLATYSVRGYLGTHPVKGIYLQMLDMILWQVYLDSDFKESTFE